MANNGSDVDLVVSVRGGTGDRSHSVSMKNAAHGYAACTCKGGVPCECGSVYALLAATESNAVHFIAFRRNGSLMSVLCTHTGSVTASPIVPCGVDFDHCMIADLTAKKDGRLSMAVFYWKRQRRQDVVHGQLLSLVSMGKVWLIRDCERKDWNAYMPYLTERWFLGSSNPQTLVGRFNTASRSGWGLRSLHHRSQFECYDPINPFTTICSRHHTSDTRPGARRLLPNLLWRKNASELSFMSKSIACSAHHVRSIVPSPEQVSRALVVWILLVSHRIKSLYPQIEAELLKRILWMTILQEESPLLAIDAANEAQVFMYGEW